MADEKPQSPVAGENRDPESPDAVKILETLRVGMLEGDPISTHLVEYKGETWVRKTLECKDESEANRIYREVEHLKKVVDCGQVSLYKHCRVHWEPTTSSVVVSLLSEHQEKGSLSGLVSQCRHAEQIIPETTVKRWVGQIVQILVTLNQQGLAHRNLRPSNVYQRSGSSEVVLGDVGVHSALRDRRLMSRKTRGYWQYTAPEAMSGDFTDKSDVWSLGAIVLDMVTCEAVSREDADRLLEAVRDEETRNELDDIMEELSITYSSGLLGLVRQMLELDPDKRPSPSDLLSVPFVQSCVMLLDDVTNNQPRVNSQQKPVPRDQGVAAVIEYLDDDVTDEDLVLEAMEYLADVSKESEYSLGDHGLRVINSVMRDHPAVELQIAACLTLNNLLAANESGETFFYPNDVIVTLLSSMTSHAGSSQLQQAAVMLLLALACNESASSVIGREGGLGLVVRALRTYRDNAALVTTCCNALWALCVNDENNACASGDGAVLAVCEALRQHPDSSQVAEAAAAAILALSLHESSLVYVGEADCVSLLLTSLERHSRNAKLVKNSCLAVASLVELDEESAYVFLSCEREEKETLQGLQVMSELYEDHKDNAEVAENIALLLMELAHYEEMTPHMVANKIPELLTNMKTAFRRNDAVIGPCDVALSRLTGTAFPIGPVPSAREKLRS